VRALRGMDREMHAGEYPRLGYPEVYLLVGGYKAFHERYPELCSPHGAYRPMDAAAHLDERNLCHQVYRHGRSTALAADRAAAQRHRAWSQAPSDDRPD
jgi:hypothetical protein